MKFIREIIAEKTNMAGAQVDSESDTAVTFAPSDIGTQEIDLVHQAASGRRALNREDQNAHHTLEEASEITEDDEGSPQELLVEAQDEHDDFYLLSDPVEAFEPPHAEAQDPHESTELFADIWDGQEEPDVAQQTEEFFDTSPEMPEPVSNARALMRTMYPQDEDAVENQEPIAEQDVVTEQEEEEAPVNSSFQRIRRRQTALPTEPVLAPEPEPAPEVTAEQIAVPAPAAGRGRRQAGRVKTRLLGFGNEHSRETDLFAKGKNTESAIQTVYPVGWMVVVSGPGRGTAFTLVNGVSQIGRGEGQAVRLDFGDSSISRENHAAIAYDPEQQEFFLGHGGKANLVRLNGKPVLSTEPLQDGAIIRIGETTLRFVGFCGSEFDWTKSQDGEDKNARLI